MMSWKDDYFGSQILTEGEISVATAKGMKFQIIGGFYNLNSKLCIPV